MKYRIIRKQDKYFYIQKKILFFWINAVCSYFIGVKLIENFKTQELAEDYVDKYFIHKIVKEYK